MSTLTTWQAFLKLGCTCLSASLSILGSSSIIAVATRKLRGRVYNRLYQRLMILLSSCDIVFTLTLVISWWTLPPSAGYPMAVGTDWTCQLSGLVLGFGAMFNNAMCCYLSLYFLLTTKYHWRERDVIQKLELPAYALALVLIIGYLTAVAVTQAIQPIPDTQICAVFEPEGTTNPAINVLNPIYLTIMGSYAITGVVATYLVYRHVYLVTQASRRHNFSTNCTDARDRRRDSRRHQQEKRVQRVARQALLYTLAILNTLLWPTVLKTMIKSTDITHQRAHEPGYYSLSLVGFTLMPLQGFFNFIIYIQNRAKGWQKNDPQLPWAKATWKAVWDARDPPEPAAAAPVSQATLTQSASSKFFHNNNLAVLMRQISFVNSNQGDDDMDLLEDIEDVDVEQALDVDKSPKQPQLQTCNGDGIKGNAVEQALGIDTAPKQLKPYFGEDIKSETMEQALGGDTAPKQTQPCNGEKEMVAAVEQALGTDVAQKQPQPGNGDEEIETR